MRRDQRAVRHAAVIALQEILERQLPVGLRRVLDASANLEASRAVALAKSAYAPDIRFEIGWLFVEREVQEDEAFGSPHVARPQAVFRELEIIRHPVRRDQTPVDIVRPRVIRTTENGRVPCRVELFHGKARVVRRWLVGVAAQARPAMTAHVVVRLHLRRLVAEHDHAFTTTVCEHEVIAWLWDAALVVRYQPEVVADVLLVLDVALFIDVILGRDGVAFTPGRALGRRRAGSTRRILRLLGARFLSVRDLRDRRLRDECRRKRSSGTRCDGCLCKIASAHLLTHGVLLVARGLTCPPCLRADLEHAL